MGVYISDANGKLKKYAGGTALYGTTGQSTTAGMTQKAITDELEVRERVDVIANNVAIQGTTYNVNVSKYKRLRIFVKLASTVIGVYEVSLQVNNDSGNYVGSFCGLSGDLSDTVVSQCIVNSAKTQLTFNHGYFNGSVTLRNNSTAYIVRRIEGVY